MLFTSSSDPSNFRSADIEIVTLADHAVRILMEGVGEAARYARSGHIVYFNAGKLIAVPFNADRMELTGSPVIVAEGVAGDMGTGTALVDLSNNGYLVYQTGPGLGATKMQWRDERGLTQPLLAEAADYQFPSLSPNGRLLAVASEAELWVYDWQQQKRTRPTTGNTRNNNAPIWTEDSQYVVFRASGELYWVRADGASPPQPLVRSRNFLNALAITPDGKTLAYSENDGDQTVILVAALTESPAGLSVEAASPYIRTRGANTAGAFSPDGRWFAYASAKSGTYEVYVRAFPDNGSEQLVSRSGHLPAWPRKGKELFYRTVDGILMVVPYQLKGGTFIPDRPRVWSDRALAASGLNRNYDVTADGTRVAVQEATEGSELPNHARLVVNFFDEIKRRVGASKP